MPTTKSTGTRPCFFLPFSTGRWSLSTGCAPMKTIFSPPAAPWFDGGEFSLVDAVFGPVFRYFDVFDDIAELGALSLS